MSNTTQPAARQQRASFSAAPFQPAAAAASAAEALADADAQTDTLIHLTPRASTSLQSSAHDSPPARSQDEEVRCWICFASASEEDRPRADWRAPCKCSLVAHEACLLDWIADMQKTGLENGSHQKPACPQCKTPISLKEEQSMVLDMMDVSGRLVSRAGAFLAFGGAATPTDPSATRG